MRGGAAREAFEFEFDRLVLDDRACTNLRLDPRLGLYAGRLHPRQGSASLGVFTDACPDRWRRLLMRRRLEREQRACIAAKAVRLVESDYLLGVRDAFRVEALRFRRDDAGDFLDNQHDVAAPPFIQLRELEAGSMALKRDVDNTDAHGDDWLRMLIAPGRRLHFASAMTLTGRQDGDDASSGASYFEIARVLIDHGAQTNADLRELWSRIVFNLMVSNTDDHLRNHGFILVPGKGWRLSPAFDMNPVPNALGLKLNISQTDNAMDLDLARAVAPYFRVSARDADGIIDGCMTAVRQWRTIATRLRVPMREQDAMAEAFRLASA